jgi:hypothetical protein
MFSSPTEKQKARPLNQNLAKERDAPKQRFRKTPKHRWRNIKSFAQFLDVGFIEVTFLMQDFGCDAF